MSIWKSPLFLTGFSIIISLFLGSIIYSQYVPNDKQPVMQIRYDENKNAIDGAPIAPHKEMPFGTDRFGVSILHKVLDGAKYTLGVAFFIAFARLFFGTILGLFISQMPKFILRTLSKLFESFYYAPATIIVALVSCPSDFHMGCNKRSPDDICYHSISYNCGSARYGDSGERDF
ncbi:hypothetical protein AWM68_01280 [Fictibacillus phosphorivorans]|uniref:ABC transmembrane type-1 domain-containing protein n=1 Tax=Fictibacillus phosphorivorans TaxID=1221500 RepID=A0A165P4C3_9BACL|nr:hypothetical protein [Fictibacillus phosphorivorans]KZE68930.1 hypothetical protein AWM68_01280 [Fictibacillus phosphorivorans]